MFAFSSSSSKGGAKEASAAEKRIAALEAENAELREELLQAKRQLAKDDEEDEDDVFFEEGDSSFYVERQRAAARERREVETRALEEERSNLVKLEEAASSSTSASAAALALAPDVSLEYTRDSPMFRRSCLAFEEAMDGLDVMLKEFADLCRKWTAAQAAADACAKELTARMRDKRHGRALFSGALAILGEAAETTSGFADLIDDVVANRGHLAYAMEDLASSATKFRVEDVGDVSGFREEVWRLGDDYEAKLFDIFLRGGSPTEPTQVAREKFEVSRFGLVRHLNFLDAQKKLALVELFGVAGPRAVEEYYARGLKTVRARRKANDPSNRLAAARKRAAVDDKLWLKILDRLEAELRGELPPPGAPRGARAVAPPRNLLVSAAAAAAPGSSSSLSQQQLSQQQRKSNKKNQQQRRLRDEGEAVEEDDVLIDDEEPAEFFPSLVATRNPTLGAPPWSAALTTEVLAAASLTASRADLAHARDEGVLKQGYLYRRDLEGLASLLRGLTTKMKRKWYRLHNGSFYVVEDDGRGESKVCDLRGCAIHRGASDRSDNIRGGQHAESSSSSPQSQWGSQKTCSSFILVRPDGHRLAFQADNDDELLKWISALRRSTKWRDFAKTTDYLELDRARAVDHANADLLADVVRANPTCAECSKRDVEWVATAVGCTLCVDCAAIHRKLGSEFAKLRALWLDKWSPLMLRYLLRACGNDKVNNVWEASLPREWVKPTPESPAHEKEQWIVAKYVWFGFIGDEPRQDDQDVNVKEDDDQDDEEESPEDFFEEEDHDGERKVTSKKKRHHRKGDVRDAIEAASSDLATAAFYDDVPGLMRAYTRRASPTWQDAKNRSRSALHVATLAGNVDAVAFLLLNGADAHQLDDDDATPLSLATASDSAVDVAQLILEAEQGEFWA